MYFPNLESNIKKCFVKIDYDLNIVIKVTNLLVKKKLY